MPPPEAIDPSFPLPQTFEASFASQYSALLTRSPRWLTQLYQVQPSTRTATFWLPESDLWSNFASS